MSLSLEFPGISRKNTREASLQRKYIYTYPIYPIRSSGIRSTRPRIITLSIAEWFGRITWYLYTYIVQRYEKARVEERERERKKGGYMARESTDFSPRTLPISPPSSIYTIYTRTHNIPKGSLQCLYSCVCVYTKQQRVARFLYILLYYIYRKERLHMQVCPLSRYSSCQLYRNTVLKICQQLERKSEHQQSMNGRVYEYICERQKGRLW